jgi:hypothetical protein
MNADEILHMRNIYHRTVHGVECECILPMLIEFRDQADPGFLFFTCDKVLIIADVMNQCFTEYSLVTLMNHQEMCEFLASFQTVPENTLRKHIKELAKLRSKKENSFLKRL